jgi:hypothetical protein
VTRDEDRERVRSVAAPLIRERPDRLGAIRDAWAAAISA